MIRIRSSIVKINHDATVANLFFNFLVNNLDMEIDKIKSIEPQTKSKINKLLIGNITNTEINIVKILPMVQK
jgi:hypothetical protein